MTILLICADMDRQNAQKEALKRAGFNILSAQSVAEGWAKVDYFDITAIVIDSKFANDIGASAFRQRFITWTLQPEVPQAEVAMELASVLRGGSKLLQ